MRKHVVIDVDTCPHCQHHTLERREHRYLSSVIHQPFYFLEWDFCTSCNYIFYDPDFRITNTGGQLAMI